jgi:hypothetical protein
MRTVVEGACARRNGPARGRGPYRVLLVTARCPVYRPPPSFGRFVISVDRRGICVGSRVISVDPRGSWG